MDFFYEQYPGVNANLEVILYFSTSSGYNSLETAFRLSCGGGRITEVQESAEFRIKCRQKEGCLRC